MKKKSLKYLSMIATISALVALASSCASPGFGPVGLIFTSTKVAVSATNVGGSKTGKACTVSYVGVVALGDASLAAAAQNGGIKTINSVDFEGFSVLGVYGRLCTIVKGE